MEASTNGNALWERLRGAERAAGKARFAAKFGRKKSDTVSDTDGDKLGRRRFCRGGVLPM
jgi:hypothetical protein